LGSRRDGDDIHQRRGFDSGNADAPEFFIRQLATIERLSLQFFGMLLLLVFIYSIAAGIASLSLATFFHAIGILLALNLAAAAAGGFLGFLFGIPRLLQRSSSVVLPAPVQVSATGDGAGSPSTGEPAADRPAAAVRAAVST
jgi:hypothetical protein